MIWQWMVRQQQQHLTKIMHFSFIWNHNCEYCPAKRRATNEACECESVGKRITHKTHIELHIFQNNCFYLNFIVTILTMEWERVSKREKRKNCSSQQKKSTHKNEFFFLPLLQSYVNFSPIKIFSHGNLGFHCFHTTFFSLSLFCVLLAAPSSLSHYKYIFWKCHIQQDEGIFHWHFSFALI